MHAKQNWELIICFTLSMSKLGLNTFQKTFTKQMQMVSHNGNIMYELANILITLRVSTRNMLSQ